MSIRVGPLALTTISLAVLVYDAGWLVALTAASLCLLWFHTGFVFCHDNIDRINAIDKQDRS